MLIAKNNKISLRRTIKKNYGVSPVTFFFVILRKN